MTQSKTQRKGSADRKTSRRLRETRRIRMIVAGLIILLTLLTMAGVALDFSDLRIREDDMAERREIPVQEIQSEGYRRQGSHFVNATGDAWMELEEIGGRVDFVTLVFGEQQPQEMHIQFFLRPPGFPSYIEEDVGALYIETARPYADKSVGADAAGLRIRLGLEQGNEFDLTGVVLNDPRCYTEYVRLRGFQVAIRILLVFSVGIICLLCYRQVKIEKIFLVAAFLLGSIYMMVMTPNSIPDENHHYRAAYTLSNQLLMREDTGMAEQNHMDFHGLDGHQNVPSAYTRLLNEGLTVKNRSDAVEFLEVGTDFPFWYLPQAIGVTVARLLNMNIFGVFYLGRILNLTLYILCVFLALRRLRQMKTMLFLIAFLPMAMQQAASFSYDAYINGVSFLFIAYLISAIYEQRDLPRRDYLWILALTVLIAPAKVVYFAIALLVILIPPSRFQNKKQFWLRCSIVALCGVGVILLLKLPFLSSSVATVNADNWEGMQNYTISYIFQHPLETAKIFLRTLWYNGLYYLQGAFGRYLGALNIVMPVPVVIGIVLLIILAAHQDTGEEPWKVTWLHRIGYFGVAGIVVFLVFMGMFLAWTSDTRDMINGVQGRYFIPVIPLVFLGLRTRITVKKSWYPYALIMCGALLQCFCVEFVLNSTLMKA